MKRVVAIVLMVVGFMALIAPECPGPLVAKTVAQVASPTVADSDTAYISAASLDNEEKIPASHNDDCDDCGNPNHACHHCHFGHCGFLANQTKLPPFESNSHYGRLTQNFHLKSFIPNLFRPPIA